MDGAMEELIRLQTRLDGAEHRLTSLDVKQTSYGQEMAVVKSEMEGLRLQAKAHSESIGKSVSDLQSQVHGNYKSTQDFISKTAMELQLGIDKVIKALGIDEDVNSGKNLRRNLDVLNEIADARKDNAKWIRRGVISAIIAGFTGLLIMGVRLFIILNSIQVSSHG